MYIQIYRWASTLSWPICAGVRKVRAPKQEQVLFMLHPNPYVFYIYVYINRERERAVERCKEGNKDRKIERAPAGQS